MTEASSFAILAAMNPDKEQKIRVSTRRNFLLKRTLPAVAALVLAACEPYGQREEGMKRLRQLGMVGELEIVSLKEVLGPDSSDLQMVSQLVGQFLGTGGRVEDYLIFAWKDNTPKRQIMVSKLPVRNLRFIKLEGENARPTFQLNDVDLNALGFREYENPERLRELKFVYTATFSLPSKMTPARK